MENGIQLSAGIAGNPTGMGGCLTTTEPCREVFEAESREYSVVWQEIRVARIVSFVGSMVLISFG